MDVNSGIGFCNSEGRKSGQKVLLLFLKYCFSYLKKFALVAADAIQEEFPDLKVDWNDEGY